MSTRALAGTPAMSNEPGGSNILARSGLASLGHCGGRYGSCRRVGLTKRRCSQIYGLRMRAMLLSAPSYGESGTRSQARWCSSAAPLLHCRSNSCSLQRLTRQVVTVSATLKVNGEGENEQQAGHYGAPARAKAGRRKEAQQEQKCGEEKSGMRRSVRYATLRYSPVADAHVLVADLSAGVPDALLGDPVQRAVAGRVRLPLRDGVVEGAALG